MKSGRHLAKGCARLVALGVLLASGAGCAEGPPAEPARPNIVVILADDLGFSDIGPYGGEIRTPHLDALAARGIRFRQFYNAARCCPTRASLLTGRYPHQAGMGSMVSSVESAPEPGPYQGYLNEESATLAELLGGAGYGTYMAGKWHVGEKPEHWPLERGFDRYFGLISGASSYYRLRTDQPRLRQMALDSTRWAPPDSGFYMTDAITDYAIRWIETHEAERPDDPFFLYLAYTAPHWPLHALAEDVARYEGAYEAGWDALRQERFRRMQDLGLADDRYVLTERPPGVPAWDDAGDQADWARRMEVYAAMVDRMDQGIGRVMDALAVAGADDNTLVLFLSDNGASPENITGRNLNDPSVPVGAPGSYVAYREPWAVASDTPFQRYKKWTYEGGIRTPLIVAWPGVVPAGGGLTDQVGHVIDLVPTLLDAAAVAPPDSLGGQALAPVEGESLLPVLRSGEAYARGPLYWAHEGHQAIRDGRWKLVKPSQDGEEGAWRLFDLEADPTEVSDLAAEHPERAASMERQWEAWAERVGVRRPPS